jgi:hypothetical protein
MLAGCSTGRMFIHRCRHLTSPAGTATGDWSALGSRVSSWVYDIAIGADGIYAEAVQRLAIALAQLWPLVWKSCQPTQPRRCLLGRPVRYSIPDTGAVINAIAISGSEVYVGGQFYSAGGVSANVLRCGWNHGRPWASIQGAYAFRVHAILVNGMMYVGGSSIGPVGSAGEYCHLEQSARMVVVDTEPGWGGVPRTCSGYQR